MGRQIWLAVVLGVLILFAFASTVIAHILAIKSQNPALFQTSGANVESFIFLRLPYVSCFAEIAVAVADPRRQIAAISIDALLCGLTLLALYRARKLGSPQGIGMCVSLERRPDQSDRFKG